MRYYTGYLKIKFCKIGLHSTKLWCLCDVYRAAEHRCTQRQTNSRDTSITITSIYKIKYSQTIYYLKYLTSWRLFDVMRTFWRHDDLFDVMMTFLTSWWHFLTSWRTCFDTMKNFVTYFWRHDNPVDSMTCYLAWWRDFYVMRNFLTSSHFCVRHDELFDVMTHFLMMYFFMSWRTWPSWRIFDVVANFLTTWHTFWHVFHVMTICLSSGHIFVVILGTKYHRNVTLVPKYS